MLRSPLHAGLLAALMLATPPAALAGGGWGVPPGDHWGHFQCTDGQRDMIAQGGVMQLLTGLTLPQCLERCSDITGCVGLTYVSYRDRATGRLIHSECKMLSKYVGRTISDKGDDTADLYKTSYVCFTDRYKRDAPWREADTFAVPDRFRSQLRPDINLPNQGAPPRNGKGP